MGLFSRKSAFDEEKRQYEEKIAELEAALEAQKELTRIGDQKLDILNSNANLGMWTAYFDEKGEIDRIVYSEDFRKMLGYSKQEFPDSRKFLFF